jgi:hypothetical protein
MSRRWNSAAAPGMSILVTASPTTGLPTPPTRPYGTIRAGIVGTPAAIKRFKQWLNRCRQPIEAKDSRLGHLFVPFPGFDTSVGFRSTLIWDSRLERPIRERDLKRLEGLKAQDAIQAAVVLYTAELDILDEEPICDVVLVARPQRHRPGRWGRGGQTVRNPLSIVRAVRTGAPTRVADRGHAPSGVAAPEESRAHGLTTVTDQAWRC